MGRTPSFVTPCTQEAGCWFLLPRPPSGPGRALPMSLGVLLVLVARILDEERFLSANLAGYKDYLVKVRYRLVPFVW